MVRGWKVALVIVVFLLSILQAVFLMYESAQYYAKIQAMAVEGSVTLCISYPPNITSYCNSTINQSTRIEYNPYYCQIEATSYSNSTINFSYDNDTLSPSLNFSMNSSGSIFINSNHTGVGNHSIPIFLKDISSCSLSKIYNYNLEVLDVNDPPIQTKNLPSKAISEASSIMPFYLRTYFIDLENDAITFTANSADLTVTIDNATSLVTISSSLGQCGRYFIYFTATDEHNLSTDSNIISVTVACAPDNSDSGGGGSSKKCISEWDCKEWGTCYLNNTQSRYCIDIFACDPNNYEQIFWKDCKYIPTCYDKIKNQDETDIDCGGSCPACPVNKTEILPTCSDGIRNQDETGIDCGGDICPVCSQITQPTPFAAVEESNVLKLLLIIILALAALSVTYIIFRKEIKTFAAKVSWWLIRRKKKQILLTDEQRDEMLLKLNGLDAKLKKAEDVIKVSDNMFQDLLNINKQYFSYAIKNPSFIEKDVERALFAVKNNNLKRAMRIFIERHIALETYPDVGLDKYLMLYYMQDLRQIILNTSNYDRKCFNFVARALPVEGRPVEECKSLLYNATVALAFNDVTSAKENYFELLRLYELLDEKGKEMIFYELSKLFNYIRYVLSWK
jgi:hypothetical protein